MNKIIGTTLVIGGILSGIFLSSNDLSLFIDISSLLFVIGFGGGLTFMRKNSLKGNETYNVFKENLILAGWIGTLMGIIVIFTVGYGVGDSETLAIGFSAAMLTVFYGYIIGNLVESYFYK